MNPIKPSPATAVWYALDLVIESGASEAVEYALMEAGALGTEVNDIADGLKNASGYFAEIPDRERVRGELAEALRIYSLPSSSARDMSLREVADEDWLGEWKKSWQPVEVGERFLIAPPWSEIADDHSRIVIRIEPGMASAPARMKPRDCASRHWKDILRKGAFLMWERAPASWQSPPQSFRPMLASKPVTLTPKR